MKIDADAFRASLDKSQNEHLATAFKARGLAVSHAASASTVFRLLELVIDNASYKFCVVIENNGRMWSSQLGSFESYDGEYVPMFTEHLDHSGEEDMQSVAEIMEHNAATIVEYRYPQGPWESLSTDMQYSMLYRVARMWYQIRKAYKSTFVIRPEIRLLEIFDPLFDEGGAKHDTVKIPWVTRATFSSFARMLPDNLTDGATTLGVKMYPTRNIHTMTTLPLVTPYNEIYCLQLCNKFIRDNIGNCFPQYYGNLVVDGGNVHLFQNSGILERFKRNEHTLEEIEKLAGSLDMQMDAVIKEQLATSQKMLRDITLMNGRVIMIYMQHMMGWSPWNVKHVFDERYGPLETQMFIFDVVYALYLLGCNYVFHSDLHVGNIIHQAVALHFRRITFNRYTMPKPSAAASKFVRADPSRSADPSHIAGGGDSVDEHALYDPERNITADVFISTTKFGQLGAEPLRPEYPHGEMTLMRPTILYATAIIDFSRAIVINPDAYDGLQPYRAEMLARNFQQVHGAIRTLGDEALADLENVNNELRFCSACEDNMAAAFRAIEGLDMYMLFKKLADMEYDVDVAQPVCSPLVEGPGKLPAFQATLRKINAIMLRSLLARLRMFNDGQTDMLMSSESLYPAIIDHFCPLLRDPACYTLEGPTVDRAIAAISRENNDPADVRFVYDFRA